MRWLLENAEFVRHVRNATRRQKVIFLYTGYVVIWVVVLLLHFMFLSHTASFKPRGATNVAQAVVRLVFLEMGVVNALVMVIGTAAGAAGSVAKERSTGTLDFLRLTSMSRRAIALGKILGGGVSAFSMVAASLPLWLLCMAAGGGNWLELAAFLAVGMSCALALGALGSWVALFVKRPKSGGAGHAGQAIVTVVLLATIFGGGLLRVMVRSASRRPGTAKVWSALLPLRPMYEICSGRTSRYQVAWMGAQVPGWAFCSAFYAALFLGFWGMLARRLGSDTAPAISRRQAYLSAVALAVLLGGAVAGDFWVPARARDRHVQLVAMLGLTTSLVLVMFLAPMLACTRYEWLAGLRRCRGRTGLRRFFWDERAGPVGPVLAIAAFWCLACLLPFAGTLRRGALPNAAWLLSAMSTLLCCVFLAALAENGFLRTGLRDATAYVSVILLWVAMPLLAAAVLGAVLESPSAARYVSGLTFGSLPIHAAIAGGGSGFHSAARGVGPYGPLATTFLSTLLAVMLLLLWNTSIRRGLRQKALGRGDGSGGVDPWAACVAEDLDGSRAPGPQAHDAEP